MVGSEELNWIKENIKILIDQNVTSGVRDELRDKEYKDVNHVIDIGFWRANDGKIYKKARKEKLFVVTHDKRFCKLMRKYDIKHYLLEQKKETPLSKRTKANKVEQHLISRYSELKEWMQEEVIINGSD